MEQYIAVHRSDYNLEEIQDLIEATNIIQRYSPQTYWEPGEDSIDFEISFDKEFNNVVKIAQFYFFGDNDYPFAVVVNNMTYCLGEKENWLEILKCAGWELFTNFLSENFEDSVEKVQDKIDSWTEEIAEKKAIEYLENLKYGDY